MAASASLPASLPVSLISRSTLNQWIGENRNVVLFEGKNDKTYILDLDGFVHPGPLLTDGIAKPGDNVTKLFHSKEFHKDKKPLEKVKILGILCPDPPTRQDLFNEFKGRSPFCDNTDLLEFVLNNVETNGGPNPFGRRGVRRDIETTFEEFSKVWSDMQKTYDETCPTKRSEVDLSDFLIRHQLPYWEFPLLEDVWTCICKNGTDCEMKKK